VNYVLDDFAEARVTAGELLRVRQKKGNTQDPVISPRFLV